MTVTTYAAARRTHQLPPAPVPSRTGRARLVLTAVLGLGLALLAAGVVAALDLATPRSASTAGSPFAVGQAVATRQGVMQVTSVERVGGLTANDLSGANHGIAGLVDADQAQVQVTVRLTNDTGKPVRYSPGRVRLRAGSDKPVLAASSSMPTGSLAPGADIEGTLGFVVGRTGSALLLELPGPAGPEYVDLGRTDRAPAGAGHSTHH